MYMDISSTDRSFINALVQTGTQLVSIAEIQKRLKKTANYVSVYWARLLDDQLISAPRRGYVQLSLPFFAEFVEQYNQEHFIDGE